MKWQFKILFLEIFHGHHYFSHLKDLWNYNRILFLFPPRKLANTTSIYKNCYFSCKFTLWHIKLYRKTSLLLITSFNLVFFSLKIQRRHIQSKYTTSFLFYLKKRVTNFQKWQLQKAFVATCFDKCFSFHVITGRHSFL